MNALAFCGWYPADSLCKPGPELTAKRPLVAPPDIDFLRECFGAEPYLERSFRVPQTVNPDRLLP